MSDDNVGAVEQYLLNFMTASARMSDAADKLRRMYSEITLSAAVRAEAAAAALALERELQRLRLAHQEILAALDRGVSSPFQEVAQQLPQFEAALAHVTANGNRAPEILAAAIRLVDRWRDLSVAASSRWPMLTSPSGGRVSASLAEAQDKESAFGLYYRAIVSKFSMQAGPPPEPPWQANAGPADTVVPNPDWKALHQRPSNIDPEMEPRLQVALARKKSGSSKVALASTDRDEISVVGEVADIQQWESLSEVRVGITVGPSPGDKDVFIVTGRIPIDRIDKVRKQPFVRSLSASQPVLRRYRQRRRICRFGPGCCRQAFLPAVVPALSLVSSISAVISFTITFVMQTAAPGSRQYGSRPGRRCPARSITGIYIPGPTLMLR
jgi:hypothetical protein